MAPSLAASLALTAWLLLSYTYPNFKPFSQISLNHVSPMHRSSVITPSLATLIEGTLALKNITGLSVVVVQKHAEPELCTWGYSTEDGDEVTPDVSYIVLSSLSEMPATTLTLPPWTFFLYRFQTLFYIGSLSKAFCVTAMGLLIDDFEHGRNVTALPFGLTELTWRTRLKDLLPDWQLMDEWASERATLHDILSHVSGVPR